MKRNHPERIPEYLQHIPDAIDRAASYTAGMDLAGFELDTRTQDATQPPAITRSGRFPRTTLAIGPLSDYI